VSARTLEYTLAAIVDIGLPLGHTLTVVVVTRTHARTRLATHARFRTRAFARTLSLSPQLMDLDLSRNDLGAKGAQALGSLLQGGQCAGGWVSEVTGWVSAREGVCIRRVS
jgi:hypothetical protein